MGNKEKRILIEASAFKHFTWDHDLGKPFYKNGKQMLYAYPKTNKKINIPKTYAQRRKEVLKARREWRKKRHSPYYWRNSRYH